MKRYGGEHVIAGNILGSSAAPSSTPARTSGAANDDTLFALVNGTVKFEHKDKKRMQVSVYPAVATAS